MAMAAARERAAPRSFECALCGWATLHVDYFGRKPPFNKSIVYLEDCFVIQDPIGDPMRPVCVGSVCVVCERQVCTAGRCSTFYTKRFCSECLRKEEVLRYLPASLQPRERPAAAASDARERRRE